MTASSPPYQQFSTFWSTALETISEAHRSLRCKILRAPNRNIVHREWGLNMKSNSMWSQIRKSYANGMRFFRKFNIALLRNNFSLNHSYLIHRTRYRVEGWGRQYLEEISTYHKCYTEPTHDHLLGVLQTRLDCCLQLMHCWLLRMISNCGWSWWLFSPGRPQCRLPQPPERIQHPEPSFDFAPSEISADLDCAY